MTPSAARGLSGAHPPDRATPPRRAVPSPSAGPSAPFAPGSVSIRLYPHNELDAHKIVSESARKPVSPSATGSTGS